jgi:hypothetical protein
MRNTNINEIIKNIIGNKLNNNEINQINQIKNAELSYK